MLSALSKPAPRWGLAARALPAMVALVAVASAVVGCRAPAGPPDHQPASASAPADRATRSDPPPSSEQADPPPSATDLHGELLVVDGQRVLRVWGTPEQMGYAHGYLLRSEILEIVDDYALDLIGPAALDTAGSLYATVADIPPRLRREAAAIVEGMAAAGGKHSARLDRDLSATDLLVLNAITDLVAIGCSSVSAWGESTADDPKAPGSPLMVRNLDWSDDPDLLRNQLLIVTQPEDPARQPVASVAFAGYIGCLSCMSDAGVSALFNMGYGDGAASPTQALAGFSPANLLLRDALERRDIDGDGQSRIADVHQALAGATHAGSYILHLLEPRHGAEVPALVLEVEADGVVARHPDPTGLGPTMLAATNHHRQKSEPEACRRYRTIEHATRANKQRFDRESLWALGGRIRLSEVVHTVLVEPDARWLGLWLRAPGEPAQAATVPVGHDLAALFAAPPARRAVPPAG